MTLQVLIDWDKNGAYTTPGEDVTLLVRRESPLEVRYGRDQSTAIAPVSAGRGSMELNNADRRFSPRNTASILYGKVKPGRPVKVTRTVSGTTYTLFQGLTDDSPINPDPRSMSVSLSLVDALAGFASTDISTQLYQGVRTGDAISLVLDAVGWTGGRDLDPGATLIPWWWEDGTDALTALDKIVRSEGPPALLTVGPDGEIVFRDRHHRLTRTASLTSQGTWRSKGVEPVMLRDFTYEESWANIINTAAVSVDVRRPQDRQVVWSTDSPITLSVGEQKVITASGSDPFYGAVTPVAGSDFTASGTVAVSLTRTSGTSVGIVLTAVGAAAIVRGLQLRANPVTVANTVQVSDSDSESIDEFGRRSYPNDLPWCSPGDAQAVVSTMVAQRAWPFPVITARFMCGRDPVKSALILTRDLSDRVHVIEPETGLDTDFYVESIQHDLSGEHDHAVTFGLEAVLTPVTPVFRFDTAGQGFNDGKFGAGVDDSSNMFRFDGTSGHRFNEGVFAG